MTDEYKHWCGNCQIRVYIRRHYGYDINCVNCPYTCEYATAMRCSTEAKGEADDASHPFADDVMMGD